MFSMKFILLLPIFALVLISGCVIPSGINPFDSNTPAGTGVVIEDFSPDFQTVYSGEEVKFTLKVKNTGSVKAEDGFAELLGLDQIWIRGENPLAQVNKGNEVFPDETRCRYTDKKITLLPEEPEAGITGGEDTCTWRYIAPPVLTGLSVNSKPRVRFYYTYKSSTIKTVTLVPREELKAIHDQGKGLPTESYSTTKSPVSIGIETASPIRTYGNSVEFPVVITLKNIGGGTVCTDKSENCKKSGGVIITSELPQWNRLKINIILPDGLDIANGSCKEEDEKIVFTGKDPQTISCIIVAKDVYKQIGVIQKNIEVTAQYGYFIDKTSDITVYPSNQPSANK